MWGNIMTVWRSSDLVVAVSDVRYLNAKTRNCQLHTEIRDFKNKHSEISFHAHVRAQRWDI